MNTLNVSEPLDGATTATVDIDSDAGHLTIDPLSSGEQVLASGTLEYFENQDLPVRSVHTTEGRATLMLKGGGTGRSWHRLPWQACGGAYEWRLHLNPSVPADITAHSGGGNVRLNLVGMDITRLSAVTGGGTMDVVLPDNAADLRATARTGGGNVRVEIGRGTTGRNTVDAHSGAGNVVVRVPSGLAARVHATSGLGKVIVDPCFREVDKHTYQSADFELAADRVEITVESGAGNVSIDTK